MGLLDGIKVLIEAFRPRVSNQRDILEEVGFYMTCVPL